MIRPLAIVQMFASAPEDVDAQELLTMLTLQEMPGSTVKEISQQVTQQVTQSALNHIHYTLGLMRRRGYLKRRLSMTNLVGRPHYKWSLTEKGLDVVTKLNFYLQPSPPITN